MSADPLKMIEMVARVCWKSEDRITEDSAPKMVAMLLSHNPPHDAMVEFGFMQYRVICDRGVSHEIVRHRLFSFAQESTRYCNYGKANEISVIKPWGLSEEAEIAWQAAVLECERSYIHMVNHMRIKPEIARSVLPTCLKTEIIVSGNFREWRHFFKMRTSKRAHPQMREIADSILRDATGRVSVVFDEYVEDIYEQR